MSLPEVILRVREMNRRSDNLVLLAAMEFLKTPVSENNVELQTSLREVLSKRVRTIKEDQDNQLASSSPSIPPALSFSSSALGVEPGRGEERKRKGCQRGEELNERQKKKRKVGEEDEELGLEEPKEPIFRNEIALVWSSSQKPPYKPFVFVYPPKRSPPNRGLEVNRLFILFQKFSGALK